MLIFFPTGCHLDGEYDILKLVRWGCTDHDTKCALKKISEIEEWLRHYSKWRVLVTGKMGSGKTTFIRGLTEDFVPTADNIPTPTGLLPDTLKVMPHQYHHEGSNCTFFDTTGLTDNENASNDYDYLKLMTSRSGDPDLLVFAIKMNDLHMRDEDFQAMTNISHEFGWKIWQKAMFILTFANLVKDEESSSGSYKHKLFFSRSYRQLHLGIVKSLRSMSVQDDVINEIPVVPVGLVSEPVIAADGRGVSWIDEFWEKAFKLLQKNQ